MPEDYKPPPGPPPGHGSTSGQQGRFASRNPFRQSHSSSRVDPDLPAYEPPHPALSDWPDEKKARPGPGNDGVSYQPPPGPPPSHGPSDDSEPPPYDPWMTVPDNSLLPPPPALIEDYSPANNASSDDAARADAWCRANHLWPPRSLPPQALSQIASHRLTLAAPPGSRKIAITDLGHGRTSMRTQRGQADTVVLSQLPLFPAQHRMLGHGETHTIYFQVLIKHLSGPDAAVALGFIAPPYPPHRLPGWHRGSLAVHGDDGRRYVNDNGGGRDFVRAFRVGEALGMGMKFTAPSYAGEGLKVRAFFTRNGKEEGGWDLHEPRDAEAQEGGVIGLDGKADLFAAVGACAGVDVEVTFG